MRYKKKLGIICILLLVFIFMRTYRWAYGKSEIKAINQLEGETHSLKKNSGKYFAGGLLEEVEFFAQTDEQNQAIIKRKGQLLKLPGARATVLVCHGFMCDKSDVAFLRMLFRLCKYPCNIMTFDFRGHGEEVEGQLCTMGKNELYDILGAVQFIKNRPELRDLPLVGYGFSMGAVSLIEAQGNYETIELRVKEDKTNKLHNLFDLLILDCPFDSSDNIVKHSLEKLKFSLFGYEIDLPAKTYLQQYAYHPYIQYFLRYLLKAIAKFDGTDINIHMQPVCPSESAKNITVPCLVISCMNDDKVPVEAVEKVYNNLAGYKRLWITNGRRHFDSLFYNPEEYTYRVMRFLENFLDDEFRYKKESSKIYYDKPDLLTRLISLRNAALETELREAEIE